MYSTEPEFVNVEGAQESIPPAYVAGPVRQIGFAMLHRLAESIPWNRIMGYLNFYKFGLSTVRTCVRYYHDDEKKDNMEAIFVI
jgi:hypothetical protein